MLKSHFLVFIVSTFKGQVPSVAGGGHCDVEALPLPSQPLSVRVFAPSKSPYALSFLPAPTSVTDPTSFPLLSAISLDARYRALPLVPVGTPVFGQ